MNSMTVPATLEQLESVQKFIGWHLEAADCPPKTEIQIQVAVEELYVNIAHYAYGPQGGWATIRCAVEASPRRIVIQFRDRGKPFNPLAKEDADTTLTAEERQIGGLGILMVKKSMDAVRYDYVGGQNVLTIEKIL